MGQIELIANENHLQERLQHYSDLNIPEKKLTVVSTRGYEDFLLDYPGVNEHMTAGDSLEELLIQLDGSQRLTMTNQERENYTNALNNGELLLYIDDESELEVSENEETIELREERLAVDKETVQSGEVVVEKYTDSKIEEFDVPVNMDNVTVERRAVQGEPLFETYNNTEDSDDDLGIIRIPVTKERIRVIKEHVVTEEIVITKEVVEKIEHVSGTVKHDDIRVSEVKNEDVKVREIKNIDIDK
ncbi:MAG: YsnF/AvaK domain-containing protein [Jeotgalicoccus sp.]